MPLAGPPPRLPLIHSCPRFFNLIGYFTCIVRMDLTGNSAPFGAVQSAGLSMSSWANAGAAQKISNIATAKEIFRIDPVSSVFIFILA